MKEFQLTPASLFACSHGQNLLSDLEGNFGKSHFFKWGYLVFRWSFRFPNRLNSRSRLYTCCIWSLLTSTKNPAKVLKMTDWTRVCFDLSSIQMFSWAIYESLMMTAKLINVSLRVGLREFVVRGRISMLLFSTTRGRQSPDFISLRSSRVSS